MEAIASRTMCEFPRFGAEPGKGFAQYRELLRKPAA